MNVIFDQLRISNDGTRLYIDAHLGTDSYLENIYIDKVTIITEDKVKESNPTDYSDGYIYQRTFEDGTTKSFSLVLDINDFNRAYIGQDPNGATSTVEYKGKNLSNHLFFVIVETEDTFPEETPCGQDSRAIAVTYDNGNLYDMAMTYTRELLIDCTIPNGFIDFILRYEALNISINTGHYNSAVKFFKYFYNGSPSLGTITKPCGCHG